MKVDESGWLFTGQQIIKWRKNFGMTHANAFGSCQLLSTTTVSLQILENEVSPKLSIRSTHSHIMDIDVYSIHIHTCIHMYKVYSF